MTFTKLLHCVAVLFTFLKLIAVQGSRPVLNVTLSPSKICKNGYLEGEGDIMITAIIDMTGVQTEEWLQEVDVSRGKNNVLDLYCIFTLDTKQCNEADTVTSTCQCEELQDNLFKMIITISASLSENSQVYAFKIWHRGTQDNVQQIVNVPGIFGKDEFKVKIDGNILPAQCHVKLLSDIPHKIEILTKNMNNPAIQYEFIESEQEPVELDTPEYVADLKIDPLNSTLEVSYKDDCNRTGALSCLVEGFTNRTATTTTGECSDCGEDKSNWLIWFILATILVVGSCGGYFFVMKKREADKHTNSLEGRLSNKSQASKSSQEKKSRTEESEAQKESKPNMYPSKSGVSSYARSTASLGQSFSAALADVYVCPPYVQYNGRLYSLVKPRNIRKVLMSILRDTPHTKNEECEQLTPSQLSPGLPSFS